MPNAKIFANENLLNSNDQLGFEYRKLKKRKACIEKILFEWYHPYCANPR